MKLLPLLCLLAAGLLQAADPEPRWLVLNHAARAAIEAKDYAKLRSVLLELKPLLPGNQRIAYNLAASEAKLGNPDAALGGLRNLGEMGLIYDLAADEDFASLIGTNRFVAVQKRMLQSKIAVTHATPAFSLTERDLLPEDIAYDSKSKRFFISSVRKSKIITADGKEFAKSNWPVLALSVDEKRRVLWASTGWVPHCEHCDEADKDKTALLAFDLDSGGLKKTLPSPLPGLLGDMTISGDGDIYVSEGIHGAVLRLPAGSDQFERLDQAGEFPSPQTPALSNDETTLYVPDYMRGIAAIDLKAHTTRWIQPADDIALNGIDGLYVYRDSFLAIQNGTNPVRIIRFSNDLKRQTILEANTLGLGEPTHGTIVNGEFFFLANSGWGAYDGKGKKKPDTAPVTSSVRKIVLQTLPARISSAK